MKKRFKERPVEQNPKSDQAPTAPSAPKVEPALCGVCSAPMPCATHDKPAVNMSDERPQLKALIEEAPDGPAERFDILPPKTIEELHERIRQHRVEKPEPARPVPTARQQAQIDAEMAAGRRNSERAAAQQALARPRQTDPTEGSSAPVFRPGNVDEYSATFKTPGQTRSKDAR